ncbi:hypothetical protein [Acinetobacter sp. WCHAc010052]|uniref:hypothetical protein n=1 Tax=Acinetobacter sp. WCHAc010052 TaxID=2004647 RepID=UPI000B3C7021|nr:hypothetical protein [Acinetobacter sp. WCHAc010052]AXY60773.1 hypothetical protein CDG61_12515 [Acinetobacter sp. WCHAc010052]
MQDQSELDNLINLAEKVSEKIDTLRYAQSMNKLKLFLATVISYALILTTAFVILKSKIIFENLETYWRILSLVTLCAITFLSIGFFTLYFFKMKSLMISIKNEQEIILELLSLIHEFNDYIYSEKTSFAEKARLNIRLKRVSFALK